MFKYCIKLILLFSSDFDGRYFWAWTDFQSYVEFMLLFSSAACFFMYLFIDVDYFVETIGFLAVFTEAMLGAPQLYHNYEKQSTEGMRYVFVYRFLY